MPPLSEPTPASPRPPSPGPPSPGPPSDSAQVRAVATEFLRLRPAIVAPLLAFTVGVLAISSAPRAQVALLATFGTAFVSFFVYERWLGRRRLIDARALLRSLVLTLLGIACGVTATGAMASPLLPMLFAPVGVGFAAFGRGRQSGWLLGLLASLIAMETALSSTMAPMAIAEPYRRAVMAAAVLDAALLLRVGVASLAAAHGRAAEILALAGDEMARTAQARTRELEALSSQVAHEVKNPLSAIRAIVEVMLESADDRSKKRLTVAAGEIARIEQLVAGYGSLARPHALDVIRREPTDVSALVDRLIAILDARAARTGVELVRSASDGSAGGGPVVFDLDRDRVREALLNLVLNALDATAPRGRVTISCAVTAAEALELGVTDTGKGMDATTLTKIGTPFFTQRPGGTGLGVALTRQVAEQHRGELHYESVVGRGTTATIRIPKPLPPSPSPADPVRDADRPHL